MRSYLIFLSLLLSSLVYGQIGAVKATIYKINGEQLDGYVKNIISSKPVSIISYSPRNRGKFQNIPAQDVRKVVLRGKKHLYVYEVDIDNRNNNLQVLERSDRSKNFEFEKKRLFLELMVDGDVPLFRTNLNNIDKYFIKDHKGEIVQLLYKKFFWERGALYVGNDYAEENNFYHRQLYSEARCLTKKMKFKPPEYAKLALVAYFKKFNSGNCGAN